jgi:hypothetical protein
MKKKFLTADKRGWTQMGQNAEAQRTQRGAEIFCPAFLRVLCASAFGFFLSASIGVYLRFPEKL